MPKKITTNDLKKLGRLVTLIEGAIIYSSVNLFCDNKYLSQFYKEKNKLARLFLILGTNIPRYVSQQQIIAISEIIKMGHKFLPILYIYKLIGVAYVCDFLICVNQIKSWINSK